MSAQHNDQSTLNNSCGLRWNAECSSLTVDAIDSPHDRLFSRFLPAVQLDGEWHEPTSWRVIGTTANAVVQGATLRLEVKSAGHDRSYHWLRATLTNNSEAEFRLGGFRFRQKGVAAGDLFAVPGERLRLYREGFTAAAAAGTVRFGECDFGLDPDYIPFAVSSPDDYDSKNPNRFSSEYVAVINDRLTDRSMLLGFISSADQVTRISTIIGENGVDEIAAYSYGDHILVGRGEAVSSEELVIMSGADGYGLLETFAGMWGHRMKALSWPHNPTGWCSWYYYFEKVTEADLLENIKYLREHRSEFPLEYFQLDDGFQSALGDWLTCCEKFPRGLEFLAREIRSAGLKPGLWLAPFMVEERSQLYAQHPEWMIKDCKGDTVWTTEWRGSRVAVLDCTVAEVTEWLRTLFSTLAKWGYEYVKLDFMMYECCVRDGVYADPRATRAQALRRGLQAIRDGMGDLFILGGTTVLGPAVGLVNGERIGTDITPYWKPETSPLPKEAPCVPNVCRNIINRSYMHERLWRNDPDVQIVRSGNNKLTENEVMLWTSALLMIGGLTLLSDRFSELTPERARLSQLLLQSADAFRSRPLDFFDREFPSVWLGRKKAGAKSAISANALLGLFNFSDVEMEHSIDLRSAGIPQYRLRDFWGDVAVPQGESLVITVPPHSCKLFLVD